ncbi:MAG: 16S rRNA (uracil(1498)-N(3))-methyltransferase [Proteobacteria bacterium]|nr:16S rRNA (uracil(1498)-N(3))-methyltransferase [Pseudomonadota bacterium]
MTIPRIFLKRLLIEDDTLEIDNKNFHYLVRIMRLKRNDKFYCVDETGREFMGVILEIGKEKLVAKFNFLKTLPENDYVVNLYFGMLKGDKNELVVNIASSLGVSRIIPVIMERTVVKLDEKKAYIKKERLQKVAIESARTSYLNKKPIIEDIKNLKDLIFDKNSLKILFSEKVGIPDFIEYKEKIINATNLTFFFGPEGGISDGEYEFLLKNDFMPLSLGSRVVKAEIAILYSISVIRFLKAGKL